MTRTCDSCFACCIAVGVRQIEKPPKTRCPFLAPSSAGACSIYNGRPDDCRKFECLWLTETMGLFKDDERPDKLGAVPWVPPEEPVPLGGIPRIHFYTTRAGAPSNSRLEALLKRLQRQEVQVILE